MAIVTGALKDFGLLGLGEYSPEIVFTPSEVAVAAGTIFATRPVVVAAIGPSPIGGFTAQLAANGQLTPATYYTITIRWLNPSGIPVGMDFPEHKLVVPPEGGNLADILQLPSNPAQVWVSEFSPNTVTVENPYPGTPTPGTWWLNPVTGDLFEWSN